MRYITFLTFVILFICPRVLKAQVLKDYQNCKFSYVQDSTILHNFNDSISYAVGRSDEVTGFLSYVTVQLNVDSTYMGDFIRGMLETFKKGDSKGHNAYVSGLMAARIIEEQFEKDARRSLGDSVIFDDRLFRKGLLHLLANNDCMMTELCAGQLYKSYIEQQKYDRYKTVRENGERFLSENSKHEGVVTTSSGLQYKVIKKGRGRKPRDGDKVIVKYTGRTIDGNLFDNSETYSPKGIELSLNHTIKGWAEGLKQMRNGAIYELYIPQNLAYGEEGYGDNIPPYSTLVYRVELVKIYR